MNFSRSVHGSAIEFMRRQQAPSRAARIWTTDFASI